MTIRLDKPWRSLTEAEINSIGGQLGVFELADDDQNTVYIGYAGGNSLFGLRGELTDRLGEAAYFRLEINSAYLTRYRELLMAYFADHKHYPERNTETERLGRLSPG